MKEHNPTDTQRLNYLEQARADLEFIGKGWAVTLGTFVTRTGETPRDAIDEAMRRVAG